MFRKSTMGRLLVFSFGLNFAAVVFSSVAHNYLFLGLSLGVMYLAYTQLCSAFFDVEEQNASQPE